MLTKAPNLSALLGAGVLTLLVLLQCAGFRSGDLARDRFLSESLEPPALRRIEPASLDSYHFKKMDYGIAAWFRFKSMAVSLTFDDGTLDQYLLAYPELEKRGIKATFFIVTDAIEEGYWEDSEACRVLFSWDQAREMAVSEHEIGSHSKSHALLYGNGEFVEDQLQGSRSRIDREIRSRRCVSLSWPYWKSDAATRNIARRYYISARAGGPDPWRYTLKNGGVVTPNPYDVYQINAMGILSSDHFDIWSIAASHIEDKSGWAVINLHGIDDGMIEREFLGWQPLPFESFKSLLDYAVDQDRWIAPYGRVSRYILERQQAVIRLIRDGNNSITLSLTDGLDDEIFDQALTVKLKLSKPWKGAEVRQNGQIMWSQMMEKDFLLFDVFPDRGPVVIRRVDPQLDE